MKTRIISYFNKAFLLLALILPSYLLVSGYLSIKDNDLRVNVSYKSNTDDVFQIFYLQKDVEDAFNEINSSKVEVKGSNYYEEASFSIPLDTEKLRIDFGSKASEISIEKVEIKRLFGKRIIEAQDIFEHSAFNNFIQNKQLENNILHFETIEGDPFIVFNNNISVYAEEIDNQAPYFVAAFSVLLALLLYLAMKTLKFAFGIHLLNHIGIFMKDIYGARKLILKLAVNDFKTKYAGSYFGILWAFVQPVITILTFWFVFQVGFRSAPVQDYPFILWFISGIIPWFFFSDATMNAMYSLVEYNYLVKKIVFKVSILPLVKVISSLFVHIFFCVFIFVAFAVSGYMPSIYNIQILYYLICLFVLAVSTSFITSSIIIFFKDFGQIVSIVLQVGMWFTPIMWAYKMIPQKYDIIFKLNPMFYIVEGYRDSFITKVWFFEKPNMTLFFWIITTVLFIVGANLFKKLKPHFSDVL